MIQSRRDHLAQFTDEQLAYHEAGHAVFHHLQGGVVTRLSIERNDAQGTYVGPHPSPAQSPDPQKALREEVAMLIAGEVAATICGAPAAIVAAGGAVDREAALRAAAEVGVGEAAARAMIDDEWPRVRARLEAPKTWKLVETVAEELIRHKRLVADLFRTTITP